jgi:hypothetical protein
MRARNFTLCLAAACAATACQRDDADSAVEENVPAAEVAAPAGPSDVAIDISRMPQTLLDSARAGYGRDTAAVGRAVRSGAAYARRQGEQASEAARTALDRSAHELDSLAAAYAAGARHTEASFDSAFARLEQAMGLRHVASSLDAWATEQRTRAGEELEAAADNLERGARNVNVELDEQAARAVADARAVATRLRETAEVSAADYERTVEQLDARLRALGQRIRRN